LNSKDNEVMFKDFQLQITNYFNTPINKHWAILFSDLIFSSFIILLEQFSPMGVPSGCVMYLFELQRQWKNVQNIQALWYIKCSIIGLSTIPSLINFQYNVTTLRACTKKETRDCEDNSVQYLLGQSFFFHFCGVTTLETIHKRI